MADVAGPGPLAGGLDYTFSDASLLASALVHSSRIAEEEGMVSNERLEFLGDAVLQLAVTQYLYETYPDLPEGQMAKIRAAVVSEPALAEVAADLGLGEALALGKGEESTGGREKPSILSDAMEAVLGAVFLDGGFAQARRVILGRWRRLVDERVQAPGARDYKTRLQEVLARQGLDPPRYDVRGEGPDHARVFTAVVHAAGEAVGSGTGTSKKRAQQDAARRVLESGRWED